MSNRTTLRRSLLIQFRVIGALLMREVLTRYGRHNIGFLWLFVEPMLFTVGVTALWSLAKMSHNSSVPIVAFALTGYSSVLLWRNMPGRCSGAVAPNFSLMHHRNVKLLDIYASRILLEIAGTSASFITLGIIFTALSWAPPPDDLLKIIFAWFLLAWFGASLALLIGALSERTEIIDKLWHPISYILFPLSGAAFMVDWLPITMQKFVLYIPIVHGIELLREGYFGAKIHAHYDLGYMCIVNLCVTLIGLSQARVVSNYLIKE